LREEGVPPIEAARRATEEVSGPLIAGTLTTLLVFGPIVFVRGLAAALFRDLSLSVVTSLSASLLLALTLMPVMMMRTGGARDAQRSEGGLQAARTVSGGHAWPVRVYEHGMMWSLAHPRTVFGLAVALLIATALVAVRLPREILPRVDEGTVVADMRLDEGTALEETLRQARRIVSAAQALGSSGIYARVGQATDEEVLSGADPGTSATAQLIVPVPKGRNAAAFADQLRHAVPDLVQGGALALDLAGQSEFGSLIGREGRLVRVEVAAPNATQAAAWADSVRGRLEKLSTLADVRDAYSSTQPQLEVTLLRERMAQRGIGVQEVVNALAGGLGGVQAGELRETDRRTPIRVRFAGASNEDLETALTTPVREVPVGQLVTVQEVRAPVEVVRSGQRPVSIVEAVVERGGTARASRDVQAALDRMRPAAGVTWNVTGADVEQRRTSRELGIVAILSVALMFLVLAGEFGSFTTPLLVMLTVPLAAAGGIFVLWITGQSLNAVSLIGMVVMIGIADNDAVVKLDAIRRFRAEGYAINDAILAGGLQRLRAIAMTSLTTIVGVLPLVLGIGSGGELYQPLAAGIIGGSVTATLVTFYLLPTAYAVTERRAEARRKRREGVEG
jgi:HAE1 family hydrophobic/amphiphilic exporter-1